MERKGFSTTQSQDSLTEDAHLVSGNRAASISSSATRRLGQESLKIQNQNEKRNDKKEFGRSVGRFSSLVDRVHRQSCGIIACTRTQFSENRLGTSCRSGDKIKESKYLFSLSERPQLRRLLANQNNKGSLQKTHWRSSTSCRKFGDLITADHNVLNEGCASRDNHW